jgi:hypothetical protein
MLLPKYAVSLDLLGYAICGSRGPGARHNTTRLRGYLADIPPTGFEKTFYAMKRTDRDMVEIQ